MIQPDATTRRFSQLLNEVTTAEHANALRAKLLAPKTPLEPERLSQYGRSLRFKARLEGIFFDPDTSTYFDEQSPLARSIAA